MSVKQHFKMKLESNPGTFTASNEAHLTEDHEPNHRFAATRPQF
jgi:hypothetical protein